MNSIKKALQKKCPEGVPYVQLESLLTYEQPTKYIVKKSNYNKSNTIPVLTAGQSFILGYTNENIGIYEANPKNPTIIFDDFMTSFHWVDFNFKVKSSAIKILKPINDSINLRYVYYAMCAIEYEPVEHTRHWISKYSKFSIPYPPVETQQEIVRILDRYTEESLELQAELQEELQARKEQYVFYRNKLFDFDRNDKDVKWKRMDEIGTFIRGNGLQKKDFTESGVGCIHYGQIYTHYGVSAEKTLTYVSLEFAKKLKKARKGDLVIATTSENVVDVCKSVAWLGEDEICVSGDAYIYRHTINPKYVSYFFQTDTMLSYKRKVVTGTKVMRVSGKDMEKFLIPVPSLTEQERIVSILDKYENLVNELTQKLQDEIQAVQEQYELYRNKLLTFKRKS